MSDGLVAISTLTFTFDSREDQTPWVWEDDELIGRSDRLTITSHPIDTTLGGFRAPRDDFRRWIPGPPEVSVRLLGESDEREFHAVGRGGLVVRSGEGKRWDSEIRGYWHKSASVTLSSV